MPKPLPCFYLAVASVVLIASGCKEVSESLPEVQQQRYRADALQFLIVATKTEFPLLYAAAKDACLEVPAKDTYESLPRNNFV